jgi:hypothetical protein
MDPIVEWAIHHARTEWTVLTGAPLLMLAIFGVALLLATFGMGKLHESRHAAHSGTVEKKDAHIALLVSQVDEYKSKLSGASPEQAARELADLRDGLQTARTEIKMLVGWYQYFTSQRQIAKEQEDILKAHFAAIPSDQKGLLEVCSVNEPEPQQYAYQILRILQNAGMCVTQTGLGLMMISTPDEVGLLIVVSDQTNPPPQAALLMAAFEAAGIEAHYDQFDFSMGQMCKLMISYKPQLPAP